MTDKKPPIKQHFQFDLIYIIVAVFAVLFIRDLWVGEDHTKTMGQTPMWRPRSYGDGTAEAIDHAVKALIDEAYRTASTILEHNRSILDAAARELLARETLGAADLAKLTQGIKQHPGAKRELAAVK